VHVAVSPASDPLAELQRTHGRFLYFAPDEIEPVEIEPVEIEPVEAATGRAGQQPAAPDGRENHGKEETA
jgi:hypothetical protein